ncbi:hypothetical protein ACH5RR_012979 [Cinchona calisaya]|uniref:Uncharacterized protein n=1 Tax=Cinchona calisaya TaxID=153742 RepID=A0ABD2ZYV9_9GENT
MATQTWETTTPASTKYCQTSVNKCKYGWRSLVAPSTRWCSTGSLAQATKLHVYLKRENEELESMRSKLDELTEVAKRAKDRYWLYDAYSMPKKASDGKCHGASMFAKAKRDMVEEAGGSLTLM